MKLEALDHPKTLDFAARLGVELPAAIGHLELLWAFTGKKAPQGNIGKWPDGAIARACYWNGDPAQFIDAAVSAGYLDKSNTHRLVIHDWKDHCPRWVLSKLARAKQEILDSSAECSGDCSQDSRTDSSGDSVREGKTRQGKGSENTQRASHAGPATEAEMPPGLDKAAWKRWMQYRKEIRKPLKPASFLAAQRKLSAFGCDQSAVVEQSIANGWTGLFALKPGGAHAENRHVDNSAPARVRRANEQRERERQQSRGDAERVD